MTSAEQLALMGDDGFRYELVNGELTMLSPAGGRHGRIAVRINKLLAIHVDDHGLGATFAAETGFKITANPDTVRAPDGAFVRQQKMESLVDDTGYLPFAPDLAVEVISLTDSFSAVENKAFAWLDAGTDLVLVIDPESKTAHLYRSRTDITVARPGEIIDASAAVPDWQFGVDEIFS